VFPPSSPQVLGYFSGGSIIWLLVYLFIFVSSTEPSVSSVTGALVEFGMGGLWLGGSLVGAGELGV